MDRATRIALAWHRRRFARLITSWMLPRRCVACRGPAAPGELCPVCREGVEPIDERFCPACTGTLPCLDCRPFRGPLRRIRAGWGYRGTGGQLVRRLKLDRDWGALGLLGHGLARRLPRGDRALRRVVVVPVPLARIRRAERGFNQAAELGRFVARRLDAPLWTGALRRTRETRPQGSTLVRSRRQNVEDAFALGRWPRRLRGKTVLLVDDVVTSGATLRACARLLRREGEAVAVEAVVACSARLARG